MSKGCATASASAALPRALEHRRPVLELKSGSTAIDAAAAASHTGALAGEDALYDTFFEQCGVCRVDSLTEMVDLSRVLAMQPVHPGRRTCVPSVSGGAGVLVADAAIACGLEVPPLSSRTVAALDALLPDFATPQNPLDITAQIATDPQLLGRVVRTIVACGEFDRMVLFCGGLSNLQLSVADGMIAGVAAWDRPCVVIWQASRPPAVERLTAQGCPCSARSRPRCWRWRARRGWQSTGRPRRRSPKPRPPGVLLCDAGECEDRLADLASPFAVKLQSPQMLHKSGSGGIVLNVPHAEVPARVREMLALAAQRGLPCEGVLVERMLPLAPADIERMLDRLRCRALLGDYRGRAAAPLAAIARVVHRLAELFAADTSVREIEVNPLVCDTEGRGFALDALVWRDESTTSS